MPMPELLIATHNRGKLREYRELFDGLPFELLTLDDAGIPGEVDETGATLEENARLKAEAYSARSGLVTLADDSGLEVDALGGEPGVQSKRYAGTGVTDFARNEYLLDKLRDVPRGRRRARFRCVIAIAEPKGDLWLSEGKCEGEIAFDQRGTNGFGYDPVFVLQGSGRRMAELAAEEKNRISHRGRAAIGAREILNRIAKG